MRVAVVGYGVEGRSAVDYWLARGDEVTVCSRELRAELPDGVQARTGEDYLDGIEGFDLVVRSPGVRPELIPAGVATTSVIREFLARCPALVLGVTGTQGKGTTCTAITAILRAAGRTVHLGGNIGVAALDFLPHVDKDDLVVLELSNLQLMDADRSPQIAVVLAVTPDHLDWHTDLDEYYAAKSAIAAFQQPDDLLVYVADNEVARQIAATSPATRRIGVGEPDGFHATDAGIQFGEHVLVPVAGIPLRGSHNVRNLTAAVAATAELADVEAMRAGLASLTPLPHRLQPVAERDGVIWVNDSLSTTPETTRAAVEAYPEPKVVLLGGSSKGLTFADLADTLAHTTLRAVLLTGQDAPKIAEALDAADVAYERVDGAMTELVARAAELAQPGDVVLLSPACASFDRYRDYADRGNQFVAAVATL